MGPRDMETGELHALISELQEVKRKFSSEEACRNALFRWRWSKGYITALNVAIGRHISIRAGGFTNARNAVTRLRLLPGQYSIG